MDDTVEASTVFVFLEKLLHRGALVAVMVLAVTLLPYVPSASAAPSAPGVSKDRSVPVSKMGSRSASMSQSAGEQWKAGSGASPAAGSAVLEVREPAVARKAPTTSVGGLPVRVMRANGAAPSRVRVEVLDKDEAETADVPVLARVSRADEQSAEARVGVEFDYSTMRGMFGAAWASRLQLVQFTDCAQPSDTDACELHVIPSKNDSVREVVTADVSLALTAPADVSFGATQETIPSAVVALVAGTSSQTGTFAKTQLASSARWAAGAQSGNFSWSYDMPVPESAGGLDPEIALDYSSGRVDGQTNGENTQTSWVGEGWDYNPGYIERSYRPCKDDLANAPAYTNATADLCWRDHNLTLVLDGQSTELIRNDATGAWRKANDDGTKIEYVTGGTQTTHNWNNERWRLTAPDGTKYHFGWNWVDNRETFSTLGAPVFSNHTGEPCYKAGGFAGSYCAMAYRWNLDRVEDPAGNVMSFFYTKEYNRTARAGNANTVSTYDRAAYLSRIEYGSRGYPQPTTPAMQVLFTTADRCLSSCGTATTPTTANWPDTPWDLRCSGTTCSIGAPTFWTARRLQSITAQVYSGSSYVTVDTWSFTHQFPATGEDAALTSPALWLASITRTGGHGTSTQALPTVTFGGTRMANRTDHNVTAGVPLTNKYRITSVANETGSQLQITYEASDCTVTSLPADPATNTKRCFPQYYTPPDNVGGWGWWNKYRVTQVLERDLVGSSPDMVTAYAYATSAPVGATTVGSSTPVLWHHNDNAWGSPLEQRSWSDFRGWAVVTVTEGATTGTRSQSRYVYFTGMHGDRTDAGENTRSVTITASDAFVLSDFNSYTGMLREEILYDAAGGQPVERTIYGPWRHRTALRVESATHAQPTTFEAWYAQPRVFHTYTWIAATNTWRRAEVFHQFDTTYGAPTTTTDNGDNAVTGDETCTSYSYARNTTAWLIDYQAEEIVTDCTASPGPANVLSGSRVYYDGSATLGAAPTKGLPTRVDDLATYTGTTANWITTDTSTYDAHGRIKTSTDALNHTTTTTTYTPELGSPVTAVTEINAAGHDTTDTLNLRGQTTTSIDANDKVSHAQYDPLGRLTKTWLPGRPTSVTPNTEYVYSVTKTAPTTVQTKTLGPNGNQISSFEIYDGLLRLRQTQSTAPDGKRVIGDVRYDSRGLTVKASAFYNNASGPTATLVSFADADVPTQRRYTYDGNEDLTRDALWSHNTEKWHTTLTYDGDRTNIDPPADGIPTTTIEDANGRTIALRQYQGTGPTGGYDETTYAYDPLDRLTTVTDPVGNTWTHTYDRLDRVTGTTDPDVGERIYGYDNNNQLTSTTDGRGEVLHRTYDALGRITALRDDNATGTLRASWTYDTLAKGQLTSSTRHHSSGSYTQQADGYTDLYQPTSTTHTIPASQGALAGTYMTEYGYHPDGTLATVDLPAKGGLAAETITSTYTDQGYLAGVTGLDTYLASAQYSWHGAPKQQILGSGGKRVRLTTTIDDATGRLVTAEVHTENPAASDTWVEKLTEQYSYNADGNITSITETNGGTTIANQCFGYDYLQQLTEAWTTTAATCQSTPSQSIVGGADAYWYSYTYDKTGNRLTDTRHTTDGDTTRTYTYPTPGAPRPHAVTGITTDGGGPTTAYTYDNGGYQKTRNSTGNPNQTLTFDAEGHLTDLANGTNTHTYIYDAEGNRLIADNPGTDRILYVGGNEYRLSHTTGQVTATRYYPNAVRTTTGGLTWTATNHHGTTQLAIDATTQTTTSRRLTPFGENRSTPPGTWPDDKGFVGGTTDPTGYTHLGAREYDPTTGRFLTADPLINYTDPQTLNAYTYAANNPNLYSDPDGLHHTREAGAGGSIGGSGPRGATGSINTGGWAPFRSSFPRGSRSKGSNRARANTAAKTSRGVSISRVTSQARSVAQRAARKAAAKAKEAAKRRSSTKVNVTPKKTKKSASKATPSRKKAEKSSKSSTKNAKQKVVKKSGKELVEEIAEEVVGEGLAQLDARLSDRQWNRVRDKPWLLTMFRGSEVHKITAQRLDQRYPGRFTYRTTGPDFLDTATGRVIELTTPGEVSAHKRRGPHYRGIEYALYRWK
ncbi:RHS repeat-associated core domain-containing protein [Micromonospora sp. C51]|uniref:RHS repeat domain-containing protein n=1 Tax=Micromonospora sp. C51 TaxID=2824879 RepID=UPI001B391967|nr:RHS repeat-associated core domain-containing protein [Micromonospora sp. C51]MBQ1049288.1 RHS repeat-associated core domain-containing protein [Micromonospora sp. C51]